MLVELREQVLLCLYRASPSCLVPFFWQIRVYKLHLAPALVELGCVAFAKGHDRLASSVDLAVKLLLMHSKCQRVTLVLQQLCLSGSLKQYVL